MENIRLHIIYRWQLFLVFLGLRIPDEFYMYHAVRIKYGDDIANNTFALAVILEIKYEHLPKKERIKAIENHPTENEEDTYDQLR